MTNPYKSLFLSLGVATQDSEHSSLLPRVVWIAPGAFIGALLGRAGSWFLWNCLYGIGSSFLSDDTYYALEGDVCLYGAIVGGVTGAIIAFFSGLRGFVSILSQHFVGLLFGVFFALAFGEYGGWRAALVAYYGGQLLGPFAVWRTTQAIARSRL